MVFQAKIFLLNWAPEGEADGNGGQGRWRCEGGPEAGHQGGQDEQEGGAAAQEEAADLEKARFKCRTNDL